MVGDASSLEEVMGVEDEAMLELDSRKAELEPCDADETASSRELDEVGASELLCDVVANEFDPVMDGVKEALVVVSTEGLRELCIELLMAAVEEDTVAVVAIGKLEIVLLIEFPFAMRLRAEKASRGALWLPWMWL